MNKRHTLAILTVILAIGAGVVGGLPLTGGKNFDAVIALSEKEGKSILVWIPG